MAVHISKNYVKQKNHKYLNALQIHRFKIIASLLLLVTHHEVKNSYYVLDSLNLSEYATGST